MQAGTALGEAAEVRSDTIHLQRGDMQLMVATSRHDGMPALLGAKDGLPGPFLTCGPRTPSTATTSPTPPGWTPAPPLEALAVARDLSSWDCPSVDHVLWVGKGAVGRVGLWEGDAAQALFADAPETPKGRGNYSGDTRRSPCRKGEAPQDLWQRRCGGAGAHSQYLRQ